MKLTRQGLVKQVAHFGRVHLVVLNVKRDDGEWRDLTLWMQSKEEAAQFKEGGRVVLTVASAPLALVSNEPTEPKS